MPTSHCLPVHGPRLDARLRGAGFTKLLAEVWPTMAARLDRSLSRRGVDRVAREDIVQDVAAEALAGGCRSARQRTSWAGPSPWGTTGGPTRADVWRAEETRSHCPLL